VAERGVTLLSVMGMGCGAGESSLIPTAVSTTAESVDGPKRQIPGVWGLAPSIPAQWHPDTD
jgi:hypothetical protein